MSASIIARKRSDEAITLLFGGLKTGHIIYLVSNGSAALPEVNFHSSWRMAAIKTIQDGLSLILYDKTFCNRNI